MKQTNIQNVPFARPVTEMVTDESQGSISELDRELLQLSRAGLTLHKGTLTWGCQGRLAISLYFTSPGTLL